MSTAAGEGDRPAVLPHPDEPASFEKHVKTLFRHRDRQSMTFAFDLWSYDDVKQNAHAILERGVRLLPGRGRREQVAELIELGARLGRERGDGLSRQICDPVVVADVHSRSSVNGLR